MPLEKRKLCEGSYVNQLKSFEHDPFLQVTPDHECATCLHPGFKKFTCSQLHGSSMVYDSQRRFSHKPTGLNTFRAYNPHTHKTFMSHKKDKKHSKDKKKLVSHGDSASLGAILSRSTASGSQIVLSSECSDDSGEDQGLHTQKPYTTPYDTNLYRRNGIYKYHSAQDEEEEKEDDEEEENELEEEEEEDENEVEEEENELEEEENELEEEENELEEEENELEEDEEEEDEEEEDEEEEEEEEDELEEEEDEEDELEKTFQSSYENNSLLQEHKGVHDLNYKSRSQKNSVWYDAGESEKETHDTMGTWDTSTQAFHTLPNRYRSYGEEGEEEDTVNESTQDNWELKKDKDHALCYSSDPVASSEYPDFTDYHQYKTASSYARSDTMKRKDLDRDDRGLHGQGHDIQSHCELREYQTGASYSSQSNKQFHDAKEAEHDDEVKDAGDRENTSDEETSSSYGVQDVCLEPYTLDQIDEVIDIVYNPSKGRCVVAKQIFQPGEIIFIELPTLVAIPSMAPDLWEQLQELNAETPLELPPIWHLASLYALTKFSVRKQNIILDKWVPDPKKPPGNDVKRVLSKLRFKVDAYRYERFLQAWRYNSFGHHMETDGLVLYNRISMISHSCSSTATWHYGEDDAFILRARQYIAQGDEITISYIGDDDLYKATHTRQEKLSGWLFTCQCDRCMDPCDLTRGFRCPCCGAGTTFFRTEKQVDQAISDGTTSATPCTLCSRTPSPKTIKKYLTFEEAYIARLDETDKSDLPDAEMVYLEAQRVFSQHWVLYSLDTLLFNAYRDLSLWDEARAHQQNRIDYALHVIPKASYTLAWLFEEIGDIFANSITTTLEQGCLTGFQKNFLARMYETAMNMLFILCGSQHTYTIAAHRKLSQVFSCNTDNGSSS